jgi:hypothetical protein
MTVRQLLRILVKYQDGDRVLVKDYRGDYIELERHHLGKQYREGHKRPDITIVNDQ